MGKANKVKLELRDVSEMTNLIQTLKDIADNKFYTLMQQKDTFRRFGETFVEFFRLISLTEVSHPMIKNDNPTVGILVVTIEGSFLGGFNKKIVNLALKEKSKHEKVKFYAIGNRSVEHLKPYTPDLHVISPKDEYSLYEVALEMKDHLEQEIMNNNIGSVKVVYSWPKSYEVQKTRIVQLLPCVDLISKQDEFVEEYENVIQESEPTSIIGFLANLWVTTRLYEILMDTMIASASAQANFLDDSVDKMRKERKKTVIKFRKAKKSDIDKSLRETFSARMMVQK